MLPRDSRREDHRLRVVQVRHDGPAIDATAARFSFETALSRSSTAACLCGTGCRAPRDKRRRRRRATGPSPRRAVENRLCTNVQSPFSSLLRGKHPAYHPCASLLHGHPLGAERPPRRLPGTKVRIVVVDTFVLHVGGVNHRGHRKSTVCGGVPPIRTRKALTDEGEPKTRLVGEIGAGGTLVWSRGRRSRPSTDGWVGCGGQVVRPQGARVRARGAIVLAIPRGP